MLVAASSCGDQRVDRMKITYDGFAVVDPTCTESECAGVWTSYPVFSNGTGLRADTANKIVSDFVKRSIVSFLSDDTPASPEEAARGFLNQYYHFEVDFPGSASVWQLSISSTSLYESDNIAVIRFNQESYTGGAHPNERVTFLTFDQQSGKTLHPADLFTNLDSLAAAAEKAFRTLHRLSPDADLNQSGFLFPDNRFILPENAALTDSGVLLHYNQYEIAPYSTGPIEFTLPYESAGHLVKVR